MEKETEATVVGLVRGERHIAAPSWYEEIQAGDILMVEANPEDLKALLDTTRLELAECKGDCRATLGSEEIRLLEAVVTMDSPLPGQLAPAPRLRRQPAGHRPPRAAAQLESTGGAGLIAAQLLRLSDGISPMATLATILVGTMLLSNVVNNAAAAVLMAPIAITLAQGMGISPDPLLMATAVGASCAFLTPVGHQSNALVMAPGGYQFGDYWRLGLPLSILVTVIAVPLILWVWPLAPGIAP